MSLGIEIDLNKNRVHPLSHILKAIIYKIISSQVKCHAKY